MIIFRKTHDVIVGTVNGKPFNLANTEENIAQIEQFQTDNASYEVVMSFVAEKHTEEVAGSNEFLTFSPLTRQYFLTVDGKTSKHSIPPSLVTYIEDSYDKNVDFMPIVKAWARLLTNPRYNVEMGHWFDRYVNAKFTDSIQTDNLIGEKGYTREVAKSLCTYQDIAITKEGLLATYKVAQLVDWEYDVEWDEGTQSYDTIKKSIEMNPPVIDTVTGKILKPATPKKPEFAEEITYTPAIYKHGDQFYSGQQLGYVYKIGQQQWLPEKAKRNLSNTFGGGGLYTGGLRYIDGYHTPGKTEVLVCFVNPADILSFQDEGNAIRVDALFPNNVWDDEVQLKSVYHSSEYAQMSEERVRDLIQAAVDGEIDLKEMQNLYKGDDAPTEKESKIS